MLSLPSMQQRRKSHLGVQSAKADEVLVSERDRRELANGDIGALDRERGDDGIEPRAVREASIHHRHRFVQAPAERGNDLLHDAQDVVLISKAHGDLTDLAVALDHHLVGPVDHYLGDTVVIQQDLEGSEAGDLVEDALDQLLEGAAGEGALMLV